MARDGDFLSLAGAIVTIRVMYAVMTGREAEAISYARNARELLPDRNLWDRSAAAWALGYALHSLGYLSEARSVFEEMVMLGQAMGNIWTLMTAVTDLALVMREQGEIHQARTLLEEALAEASQKGTHNLGFFTRPKANLALLLYEQNELEEAQHLLSEALALTHLWPNPNHMAIEYALQALLLLANGDLPGAWISQVRTMGRTNYSQDAYNRKR